MKDFTRILFKQKILIAVCMFVFLIFTFIRVFTLPQIYESTTLLKFESKKNTVNLESDSIDITDNMKLIKSHKVKIKSRPVLKQLIKSLNLTKNKNFAPPKIYVPKIFQGTFKALFPSYAFDSNGSLQAKTPLNYTLKKLENDVIKIEEVPFTSFLKIKVRLKEPETAADIAKELADEYIIWNTSFKKGEIKRLYHFITKEVEEMRFRVEHYENEIEEFKKNEGLKLSDANKSETGSTLENISILSYQTEMRVKIKSKELYNKTANDPIISRIIENISMQSEYSELALNLNKIEMKRALLLKNYTDQHPKIKSLTSLANDYKNDFQNSYLKELERNNQLLSQTEFSKAKSCITIALDLLQLNKRNTAFSGIKNDVYEKNWEVKEKYLPSEEKELNKLQREFSLNESIYKYLVHEREKVRIAMAKENNEEIKIVQKAEVPDEPIKKPFKTLVIGVLLSILLSISLGFLFELRNTTFGTPSHLIEKELGIALLATLPYRHSLWNRHFKINTNQTNRFKPIQARIDSVHTQQNILITSSNPGEGKTTTAVNLARLLSATGKSVLLVDFSSFKKKTLLTNLKKGKMKSANNISENNEAQILNPKNEQFNFLHIDNNEEEIIKLLSSQSFYKFIENISVDYDYILYDTPSLASSNIPLYLSKIARDVLLVVEAEKTRKDVINRTVKSLNDNGANVMGILLNKVKYHIPNFIYKNFN